MSAAVRKVAKARETAGSAVAQMRAELADLAAKRADLVERREMIVAAPIDKASAEARIDDLVQALAAGANLPGGALVEPGGYAEAMRELTAVPLTTGPAAQPPPNPWAVLAAVAPDLLKQTLLRQVQDAYDRLPTPMPAAERRTALAELDKELAAVEAQASTLWWEALDADIQLPVPDVAGAALLGLAVQ